MDATRLDRISERFSQSRFTRRRAVVRGGAALAATALAAKGFFRATSAQDATPSPTAPPTWEEIDVLMTAGAPETALLAAELINGAIEPIHGLNPDVLLPVGSSFKFWILGALATQIDAGTLTWDQLIPIEERYKSVPSGDLRYAPDGDLYTLRYLAERMMQKSDNTATDHLLFLAGRENVEAAMVAMGHSDPTRTIPLISTRELAMLKFVSTTDELDAYYAAPVADRRRILSEEIDIIPYEALGDLEQTVPIEIDRVEWFASRNDLARTVSWLLDQSQRPGMRPVLEVMALETQLTFNGEVWPYVGFKGGSELGVLSGTWLLQRADGRHFVFTVGFKNPDAVIDMPAAIAAMEAGRDRLALTP